MYDILGNIKNVIMILFPHIINLGNPPINITLELQTLKYTQVYEYLLDINDAVIGWETASWESYKESFLRESKMHAISLTLSRPGPVKKKPFIPKNNLPRLDNYSEDPPESYWESWPKV